MGLEGKPVSAHASNLLNWHINEAIGALPSGTAAGFVPSYVAQTIRRGGHSSAGQSFPESFYWQGVPALCDRYEILLIAMKWSVALARRAGSLPLKPAIAETATHDVR